MLTTLQTGIPMRLLRQAVRPMASESVVFGRQEVSVDDIAAEAKGLKKLSLEELKSVRITRTHIPSVSDTFDYGKAGQTKITTLHGGEQIFGAIDQILSKTKQFVVGDLYTFQSPGLHPDRSSLPGVRGRRVQGELLDRLIDINKKHKVRLVLDNHLDRDIGEGQNQKTIDYLKANGVDVVAYPNISAINHIKAIIVDNQYAVIGGMNWGNHSATNKDAAILIEGPDVANIYNKIFKQDWLTSGRLASEIPSTPEFSQGQLKIMTTASRKSLEGAKQEIYEEILSQISQAQESIYAQLFVLTQTEIIDNLILAHQRLTQAGKEGVKLMVDPGLFFQFPNTRKGVQKLAAAGIPIQFFASTPGLEEKLHSKWAVFDQKRTLIGSANWSNIGLLTDEQRANLPTTANRVSKNNHEMAVLVDSEKIAQPFIRQFLYDWRYASFPIMELNPAGEWKPIKPQPEAFDNPLAVNPFQLIDPPPRLPGIAPVKIMPPQKPTKTKQPIAIKPAYVQDPFEGLA